MSTAILSLAIFMVGFWVFGVARMGTDALHTARSAVAILRDESVGDDTREKAVRRASVQLFSAFISILARSALTLLASFMPIWLADVCGLVRTQEVFEYLLRWDVIFIATMVLIVAYLALRWFSYSK